MTSLKEQVDTGVRCRECLDTEDNEPRGYKFTCASCTRQLAWEEKRDEEYEYGDKDPEY